MRSANSTARRARASFGSPGRHPRRPARMTGFAQVRIDSCPLSLRMTAFGMPSSRLGRTDFLGNGRVGLRALRLEAPRRRRREYGSPRKPGFAGSWRLTQLPDYYSALGSTEEQTVALFAPMLRRALPGAVPELESDAEAGSCEASFESSREIPSMLAMKCTNGHEQCTDEKQNVAPCR